MRKIYFRADAGPNIGYGHFIRSLALADMLKDDFECIFFTQAPTEYQKQEAAKVCKLVELPAGDSKFEKFLEYLTGDEIVVLDNYFYDTDYQKNIRTKGSKLICIDDMHHQHYVADAVVNHCIDDPNVFSVEEYTKLCLGLDYALLRKPFLSPFENIRREKGHWLVSFGGSDINNLTSKFLNELTSVPGVNKITIIIGDGFAYQETLTNSSGIEIVKNLSASEMRELMLKAEYAIVPSSSICIEAISSGCKVLSGYYVDNQYEFYQSLKERRLIYPLDNLLDNRTHLPKNADNVDFRDTSNIISGYQIRQNFKNLFSNI